MIYITGDTHGDFTRFSNKKLRKQGMELTEEDYVIVCGDFGLCWAKNATFDYDCKNFAEKRYTILWVQGNHENYDMIAEYPIEKWHGGNVRHIVRDKVILLERGQVFELEGKKFFTFGGASSHDVQGGILDRNDCDFDYERRKAIDSDLPFRIVHESWWKEELPSVEEMEEGRRNLAEHDFCVDYVITHCCATEVQNGLDRGPGHVLIPDVLTDYLQEIEERLQYKHWYFGHYHMDVNVDNKHTLLYHGLVELDEDKELKRVPIPGRPRFRYGDVVSFSWGDVEKVGKIDIIDPYGTFEQREEPSYDILVEEDNCVYKHICESEIVRKLSV